jgi:hypothetical protein
MTGALAQIVTSPGPTLAVSMRFLSISAVTRQRVGPPAIATSGFLGAYSAAMVYLPVFVGDEVSCYGRILKVRRTSITINV